MRFTWINVTSVLIVLELVSASAVSPKIHFWVNVPILALLAVFYSGVIRSVLRHTWPLVMIMGVALLGTMATPAPGYDVGKGLWYLSKPVVYLAIGGVGMYVLRDARAFSKCIVTAALVLATVYVGRFYFDPTVDHTGRFFIRHSLGVGSVIWGVALAVILFVRPLIFPNRVLLALGAALIALAIYLSDSRTTLLSAVIISLCFAGALPQRQLGLASAGVAVALLLLTTPVLAFMGFPVGYDWVSHVPMLSESAPILQGSLAGINDHWRGHETFLAFRTAFDNGPSAALIGLGLGAPVPVGFPIWNGERLLDELAIFHNGYSLLLVRSGLFGIGLYVAQLVVLARGMLPRGVQWQKDPWCIMGAGLLYALTFTMFIVAGMYNGGDVGATLPMLAGGFMVYSLFGAPKLATRAASPAAARRAPSSLVAGRPLF